MAGAPVRCKACGSARLTLDRIFPTQGGHTFQRYRCEDCGHYRSKHVLKVTITKPTRRI